MSQSNARPSTKRLLTAWVSTVVVTLALILTANFLAPDTYVAQASATTVFFDAFDRADEAYPGNGWIERDDGATSISANQLRLANSPADFDDDGLVARPMSEAQVDQEVRTDVLFGETTTVFGLMTRMPSEEADTGYYAMVDPATGGLSVGAMVAGKPTALAREVTSALDRSHSYRVVLSVAETSPTTLTASLHDLTLDARITSIEPITDGTLTLQDKGTVGMYANSDNTDAVFVEEFGYMSNSANTLTLVPISSDEIVTSPYTWYSADGYKQANSGGAYIKLAFTGTRLGLGVDTKRLGAVSPESVNIRAYIDGETTPIAKTLADEIDGQITFSYTLTPTDHYAVIYVGFTPAQNNRWADGAPNSVIVTHVLLAADGLIKPIAGTPIRPEKQRVIFYGDSITEGAGATAAERGFAPLLAQELQLEYGQLGYSGSQWSTEHASGVPAFFSGNTSVDAWSNYSAGNSRLANGSYRDGSPDAIFVGHGVNDARANTDPAQLRTSISGWLDTVRAKNPDSDIYLLVPFNFGSEEYRKYKDAYIYGYRDYRTANPDDFGVYFVDLGKQAWSIVQANSADGLHPNTRGAQLLAALLQQALTPMGASSISAMPSTLATGSVDLMWGAPKADANNIAHAIGGFNIQYKTHAESTWTTYATVDRYTNATTVPGLTTGTPYDFRVVSLSTGLVTGSPTVQINNILPSATAQTPDTPQAP